MTTVVEPDLLPGTNEDRHPWFQTDTSGPPRIPPDTKITTFSPLQPPDEDTCPGCEYAKEGVCECGYDWDHNEWIDRSNTNR